MQMLLSASESDPLDNNILNLKTLQLGLVHSRHCDILKSANYVHALIIVQEIHTACPHCMVGVYRCTSITQYQDYGQSSGRNYHQFALLVLVQN